MDKSIDIELIVREVVQRLKQHGDCADIASSSSEAATLVVEDRVVTANLIQGQLKGIEQIRVRPDAVVTPLVRDELKAASVRLIRSPQGSNQQITSARLLVEDSRWSAQSVLDQLSTPNSPWCLARDWASLIEQLRRHAEPTVVCSDRWAARLCAANRDGVTTVVVDSTESLDSALQQVAVVMIVIDSTRTDVATAAQIARAFIAKAIAA